MDGRAMRVEVTWKTKGGATCAGASSEPFGTEQSVSRGADMRGGSRDGKPNGCLKNREVPTQGLPGPREA
jgi:hypothetical protein